jgi:GST-like protein
MNTRLAQRPFHAGRYSIADISCVGWVRLAERQGTWRNSASQTLVRYDPRASAGRARFCHSHRGGSKDPKVRAVLFGQRTR